jgi:hypothetical protein
LQNACRLTENDSVANSLLTTETLGERLVETPETHYARSGDVNIAYQVLGDGPFDLPAEHSRPRSFACERREPQSASSSLSGLSTSSVVRILRGDAIIDPGTQERLAVLDR